MSKINLETIKEFIALGLLNIKVQIKNLCEYLRVIWHYYKRASFAKIDISLLLSYFLQNPFKISKHFLLKKGEEDVYTYGETPLTTLDFIARQCRLSSQDTLFELGCGRGRGCFWLNQFIGCKVVGIDHIPEFIQKAEKVKNRFQIQNITFRLENFLKTDFSGATAIYLYGTCYSDEFIQNLSNHLLSLPSGTKIITISYPLTEFNSKGQFEVMKRFPGRFTWGEADVYLQIRR